MLLSSPPKHLHRVTMPTKALSPSHRRPNPPPFQFIATSLLEPSRGDEDGCTTHHKRRMCRLSRFLGRRLAVASFTKEVSVRRQVSRSAAKVGHDGTRISARAPWAPYYWSCVANRPLLPPGSCATKVVRRGPGHMAGPRLRSPAHTLCHVREGNPWRETWSLLRGWQHAPIRATAFLSTI